MLSQYFAGMTPSRIRRVPSAVVGLCLCWVTAVIDAAPPYGQPTVIACVGNSITDASGYVAELQSTLGGDYDVLNCGHDGRCVLRGTGYASYWQSPYMDSLFDRQPHIVTIMLGTNDGRPYHWESLGDQFFADYCDLIDTLRTINALQEIHVCLPPPCFEPSCCSIVPTLVNDSVVPLVDSAARTLGVPVIDCHTPLLGHPELFVDGVHPTHDGGLALAQIIYDGLTETASSAARRPRRETYILAVSRSPLPCCDLRGRVWPVDLEAVRYRANTGSPVLVVNHRRTTDAPPTQ